MCLSASLWRRLLKFSIHSRRVSAAVFYNQVFVAKQRNFRAVIRLPEHASEQDKQKRKRKAVVRIAINQTWRNLGLGTRREASERMTSHKNLSDPREREEEKLMKAETKTLFRNFTLKMLILCPKALERKILCGVWLICFERLWRARLEEKLSISELSQTF